MCNTGKAAKADPETQGKYETSSDGHKLDS